MLEVAHTSWHYRLFKWEMRMWESKKEPTSLCPYFWTLFLGVPGTVFVWLILTLGDYLLVKPFKFVRGPQFFRALGRGFVRVAPWSLVVLKPLWRGIVWFFSKIADFIDRHQRFFRFVAVGGCLALLGAWLSLLIYESQRAIGWWTIGPFVGGPIVVVGLIVAGVLIRDRLEVRVYNKSQQTVEADLKPKKIKGTPFYRLIWAFLVGKKKRLCPVIKVV